MDCVAMRQELRASIHLAKILSLLINGAYGGNVFFLIWETLLYDWFDTNK